MVLTRNFQKAVDIVIPVYNAPCDLATCINSLLGESLEPESVRIILINDGSTDPEVLPLLEKYAADASGKIIVLHNGKNEGFVKTANRGMNYDKGRDVVLLNSDTIVSKGWLDALRRCAYSDVRIATVTPFSNNAEICSYPELCVNAPWPEGKDPESTRAALAKAAVPSYPEIPTGVGFCFYIKRAAIEAIGVFDEAFGAGYGEENDFCLRARKAGFRNVLCDDAFVVHTGGRSFAGRKTELSARNMSLLLSRHPEYLEEIRDYIARDPLRGIREAARLEERKSEVPRGVLHILHDRGGGTEKHVRDLLLTSPADWRQYLVLAKETHWRVEWREDEKWKTLSFEKQPEESWPDFVGALAGSLGVGLIHVHHLSGCREGILTALQTLELPYGYTIHDMDAACPVTTLTDEKGKYCGASTEIQTCVRCVASQRGVSEESVETYRAKHRAFVARAAFLMAPTRWAAETFSRYFPGVEIKIIAHGIAAKARSPRQLQALILPDDGVPTVAVLGAIGPNKGARRLEKLVELAWAQKAPVRFVVIGYLDCQQGPWQSDDAVLTVHGRYDPQDLPALMDHYRVRLVLFPAHGPETFSYTLSEAWWAGRQVLVPPFGALAERVRDGGGGGVLTQDEWKSENALLEKVLVVIGLNRKNADEKTGSFGLLTEMAEKVIASYVQAREAPPNQEKRSFSANRIRQAIGHDYWGSRATAPGEANNKRPLQKKILVWGICLGLLLKKTALGHGLYCLMPASLIEKLKRGAGV